MRVGLIGAGRMGAEHLKSVALVPGVDVVGVTDRVPDRARQAAERYQVPRVYDDVEALIRSDEIDVVDIVTPPSEMPPLVQAACEHGKSLLCEKPLGVDAAQARAMFDAVSSAGVVHALCHQRRYDPVHRYVRDLVTSGFVGSPLLVSVQVMTDFGRGLDPSSWVGDRAAGGGLFLQLCSHYLDLLRFTFGELELSWCDGSHHHHHHANPGWTGGRGIRRSWPSGPVPAQDRC